MTNKYVLKYTGESIDESNNKKTVNIDIIPFNEE